MTDANIKLLGGDVTTQSAQRDAPTVFRFKAKVTDPNLAPTKVRFEAVSDSNKQMSDAVEITIPVQAPTIVRKESVAASFNGPQVGIRCSPRNARSVEARPRPFHHNDFNFAVAATDVGTSGDSGISARLLRTNFDQAAGIQFARERSRLPAGFSATRCRISRHARARHETVCRLGPGGSACSPTGPAAIQATVLSHARRFGPSTNRSMPVSSRRRIYKRNSQVAVKKMAQRPGAGVAI